MNKIIICDLDGTLFDHTHRRHLSDAQKFDEYNSKLHLDSPKKAVHEILHRMAPHHPVILITGRPDKWEKETRAQLQQYHVPYDDLYMRKEGDMQSDVDLKRGIFAMAVGDASNVLFVLEDRDCVVDMWRSIGLTCLQVERFEVKGHNPILQPSVGRIWPWPIDH